MTKTETVIGLGDTRVSADSAEEIICYGLGSCVGVALYDHTTGIAGMAHVVLPDSSDRPVTKAGRFANTAIPALLDDMLALGANRVKITARLVGGAQLVGGSSGRPAFRIGPENVAAAKAGLAKVNVRVVGEDTGGHEGRTVHFRLDSGELEVHSKDKIVKI